MILLAGAGSIGKRHLANLVACGKREFLVVDPREDRRLEAQEWAQGAMGSGTPADERGLTVVGAASLDEAEKFKTRLQAVVIATPPLFHPEAIRLAVRNRLPILCEKPLAGDDLPWEELRELVQGTVRAGLLTLMAYNYRFCPQLQRVRQMLREGAVGQVLSV